ncbi:MAG: Gfo/Idh/MocA family oxidoreductase [Ktedonobacteraceae bacterium]
MKQFNVALVGCGNIAHMHFAAYLPHPERVHIVAVCDTDPQRVHDFQQQYGVQGFISLEEMLVGAEWEVGVICTPTPVRKQVVAALARAGKHLFVEKPFADSYADVLSMVESAQRAGVQLAINQNFRYHYPFDMAREMIIRQAIGPVVSVLHQDLMFRQDSGWRAHTKRHALSVMGVHWFDGFRRILNDEASSLLCRVFSSPAIDCEGETDASALITFKRGALVSYTESFSTPKANTETTIIGERGELLLNYDGIKCFDRDYSTTPREEWENPYRGAQKPEATFVGLNLLLDAIEAGTTPANSGEDNMRTIALLDGAYRSAETGRTVTFEEGVPL